MDWTVRKMSLCKAQFHVLPPLNSVRSSEEICLDKSLVLAQIDSVG